MSFASSIPIPHFDIRTPASDKTLQWFAPYLEAIKARYSNPDDIMRESRDLVEKFAKGSNVSVLVAILSEQGEYEQMFNVISENAEAVLCNLMSIPYIKKSNSIFVRTANRNVSFVTSMSDPATLQYHHFHSPGQIDVSGSPARKKPISPMPSDHIRSKHLTELKKPEPEHESDVEHYEKSKSKQSQNHASAPVSPANHTTVIHAAASQGNPPSLIEQVSRAKLVAHPAARRGVPIEKSPAPQLASIESGDSLDSQPEEKIDEKLNTKSEKQPEKPAEKPIDDTKPKTKAKKATPSENIAPRQAPKKNESMSKSPSYASRLDLKPTDPAFAAAQERKKAAEEAAARRRQKEAEKIQVARYELMHSPGALDIKEKIPAKPTTVGHNWDIEQRRKSVTSVSYFFNFPSPLSIEEDLFLHAVTIKDGKSSPIGWYRIEHPFMDILYYHERSPFVHIRCTRKGEENRWRHFETIFNEDGIPFLYEPVSAEYVKWYINNDETKAPPKNRLNYPSIYAARLEAARTLEEAEEGDEATATGATADAEYEESDV